MHTRVAKIAVFLLISSSLVMSFSVVTSISDNFVIMGFLAIAVIGIELVKLYSIDHTAIYFNQQSNMTYLSAFCGVCSIVLSIFINASFFESSARLQDDALIAKSRNNSLRNMAIKKEKIAIKKEEISVMNADTFAKAGRSTESRATLREIPAITEHSAIPAIPAIQHTARAIGIFEKLGENKDFRFYIFIAIAAIIDFFIAAMLIMIANPPKNDQIIGSPDTPKKSHIQRINIPGNNISPAIISSGSHPDKFVSELIEEIEEMPSGDYISATKMMKKYSLRHPQVKEMLDYLMDIGVIEKQGNRYVKVTYMRSV